MAATDPAIDPAIKTPPMEHQLRDYLRFRDLPYFALFWEMGLGKAYEAIIIAAHNFLLGRIRALLIVAPKSVYQNWLLQEIPPHMAVKTAAMCYHTGGSGSDEQELKRAVFLDPDAWGDRLRVVCMSYDSMVTERGRQFAMDLMILHPTMMVLDESTAISSTGAGRTEVAQELGRLAKIRAIETGTPIAQSPFQLHSQIAFLDPDFWANHGLRSYSAFKTHFGVFEQQRAGRKIFRARVGYRNLDRLWAMIAPFSSRLLKDDSSVRLPPKTYTINQFDMTPAQRKVYEDVRRRFAAEIDEMDRVEAPLAIVRLARLQQITCGFVTAEHTDRLDDDLTQSLLLDEDEDSQMVLRDMLLERADVSDDEARIAVQLARVQKDLSPDEKVAVKATKRAVTDLMPPEQNPRLQLLLELLGQYHRKVIVWCKFRRDVDQICDALDGQCVRYDGSVKTAERVEVLRRFRDPDDMSARVLVANQHAISQGVTLIIAKLVIYYSNSFSLEKRLQTEDRAHRIGQNESVQIVDIVATNSIDEHVVQTLREKFDLSASVLGDKVREWIGMSKAKKSMEQQ